LELTCPKSEQAALKTNVRIPAAKRDTRLKGRIQSLEGMEGVQKCLLLECL
jgi:hypothetical protein